MIVNKYNRSLDKRNPSWGIVTPGFSSPHFCGICYPVKFPSRYENSNSNDKDVSLVYVEHDESTPQIAG